MTSQAEYRDLLKSKKREKRFSKQEDAAEAHLIGKTIEEEPKKKATKEPVKKAVKKAKK